MSLPPITMKVGTPEWDEYKRTGRLPSAVRNQTVGEIVDRPNSYAIMRQRSGGKTKVPGEMTGTERAYAEHLELLRLAGDIASWRYEDVKLRLAERTFYLPDFAVTLNGGVMEFHEVKAFWRAADRIKIKVAAAQYREFRFIAATKKPKADGGGWEIEEF